MRVIALGIAVVVCIAAAVAAAAPKKAADVPPEEHARQARDEKLSRIEADYTRAKADVLRQYAEDLTDAELDAVQSFDNERAQRLFDEVQSVRDEIKNLPDQPGAADVRAAPDFAITISDFNGAAGFTKVLDLTPATARLRLKNDFGRPPQELWRADLAADQRDRLAKFLATFPLDKLRDRYVGPSVFDGYQVTFEITIGKAGPRKIFVGNQRQRDLAKLVLEVNRILPPKYWISRIGADEPGSVRVRRP